MKPKEMPNITKEMLDEYHEKVRIARELSEEVSEMSKKIKYEMNKVDRLEVDIHGYSIDIEKKYEPSDEFFKLMFKKDLDHLVKFSINSSQLKSALRKLCISDHDYYENYAKEKDTKWLHVIKK